jgi:hypothetical protein
VRRRCMAPSKPVAGASTRRQRLDSLSAVRPCAGGSTWRRRLDQLSLPFGSANGRGASCEPRPSHVGPRPHIHHCGNEVVDRSWAIPPKPGTGNTSVPSVMDRLNLRPLRLTASYRVLLGPPSRGTVRVSTSAGGALLSLRTRMSPVQSSCQVIPHIKPGWAAGRHCSASHHKQHNRAATSIKQPAQCPRSVVLLAATVHASCTVTLNSSTEQ